MSDFKITGPGFYRTSDGKRAEVVGRASVEMAHGMQWVGVLDGGSECWKDDGSFLPGGETSSFDLIAPWTEPKKGTVWVNVYEIGGACACGYSTRKEADASAGPGRLACVSVNWTEGEGLS